MYEYLSCDLSLTASLTVLLQQARVTQGSAAVVSHLIYRVASGQAAVIVGGELRQALERMDRKPGVNQ